MDGLEKIQDQFTEKEIKTLKHYISNSKGYSHLYEPHWSHYYDTYQNKLNIEDDLIDNIKYYLNYSNINKELISKYAQLLSEYLEELSAKYETEGYSNIYYDYEGAEMDIIDNIRCNEYEFYSDGTIYTGA